MAKKRRGTAIALISLAGIGALAFFLTRAKAQPPTEQPPVEGTGGGTIQLVLSQRADSFFGSPALPNDVTVTLMGTVTGGSTPITMGLNIEFFDPRINTWVVINSLPVFNAALNVPQTLSKTYFPIDLASITGQSSGSFRVRGSMSLSNIIAPGGVLFLTPEKTFTVGQAPTGTVTVGAA